MAQNDENLAKDLGGTTGSHMHMPRNNSMVSLPSRGKSYAANRLSIRFKRALADRIEQDRSTSLINSTNTMFPPSNANSSAFDQSRASDVVFDMAQRDSQVSLPPANNAPQLMAHTSVFSSITDTTVIVGNNLTASQKDDTVRGPSQKI